MTDAELIRLAGRAWREGMEKTAYNPFKPMFNVLRNAWKEQAGKGLYHAVDSTAPRVVGGVLGGLAAPFMPAARLAGGLLAAPVVLPAKAAIGVGKWAGRAALREGQSIAKTTGGKLGLAGAVGFTALMPPVLRRPKEDVMGIALDQRRVAQGLPQPVQW